MASFGPKFCNIFPTSAALDSHGRFLNSSSSFFFPFSSQSLLHPLSRPHSSSASLRFASPVCQVSAASKVCGCTTPSFLFGLYSFLPFLCFSSLLAPSYFLLPTLSSSLVIRLSSLRTFPVYRPFPLNSTLFHLYSRFPSTSSSTIYILISLHPRITLALFTQGFLFRLSGKLMSFIHISSKLSPTV